MKSFLYKLRNKLWIFALAMIPFSMLMMVLPADKKLVPLSMIELMTFVPWIFCLIEAALLVLSIVLFAKKIGNKLNILLVCVSIFILAMFGTLGLQADISRSPEKLESIESEIGIDFPDDVDLIANEMSECLTIIVKLNDGEFEQISNASATWSENIDKVSLDKIPDSYAESKFFTSDHFLIYNSTKGEFTESVENNTSDKFIFIGYDKDEGVLTICKEK